MKTKYIIALIAFVLLTNMFAQSNLNNYKYVVVPQKFDFLKEADKYQLNSLTKFLLEKENFTVFLDYSDLPEDLSKNRCLGLFANVIENSGMFKTKLTLELKDCNNSIVFKSKEGTSKNKDYKKAFHEALRDAFKSFEAINYSYKQKKTKQKVVEVKPVEQSIKEKTVIKETPIVEKSKVPKTPKKDKFIIKEDKRRKVERTIIEQTEAYFTLYAQRIDGGYQLVDSTPKIVMILLRTPKQDVYIVKGQDAIVYKSNGKWLKSANATASEVLNIKF